MKAKFKLKLIMIVSIISLLTLMEVLLIYSQYRQSRLNMENSREILMKGYDTKIKGQVNAVISMIKRIDTYYAKSGKSLNFRMKMATELLRNVNYSKTGYFWIDKSNGTNVLNPLNPLTEGINRLELKDINGKLILREIIKNAAGEDGGFTEYWYKKPGNSEVAPKRSYSRMYRPFDWVIGTGNYIDDIMVELDTLQEKADGVLYRSIALSMIIFILAVIVAVLVSIKYGDSIFCNFLSSLNHILRKKNLERETEKDKLKFEEMEELFCSDSENRFKH